MFVYLFCSAFAAPGYGRNLGLFTSNAFVAWFFTRYTAASLGGDLVAGFQRLGIAHLGVVGVT